LLQNFAQRVPIH